MPAQNGHTPTVERLKFHVACLRGTLHSTCEGVVTHLQTMVRPVGTISLNLIPRNLTADHLGHSRVFNGR